MFAVSWAILQQVYLSIPSSGCACKRVIQCQILHSPFFESRGEPSPEGATVWCDDRDG